MSIVTCMGDNATTGWGDGIRLSKTARRVIAMGDVDEQPRLGNNAGRARALELWFGQRLLILAMREDPNADGMYSVYGTLSLIRDLSHVPLLRRAGSGE